MIKDGGHGHSSEHGPRGGDAQGKDPPFFETTHGGLERSTHRAVAHGGRMHPSELGGSTHHPMHPRAGGTVDVLIPEVAEVELGGGMHPEGGRSRHLGVRLDALPDGDALFPDGVEGGRWGVMYPSAEEGRGGLMHASAEGGLGGVMHLIVEGGLGGEIQPSVEGGRGKEMRSSAEGTIDELFPEVCLLPLCFLPFHRNTVG